MSNPTADPIDQGQALLDLYDHGVAEVYGYLFARCGHPATAEDLTSETFMAAVDMVNRRAVPSLTTAWLIGVARHKLVDHWRREAREQRKLQAVDPPGAVDDWDARLDAATAHATLARLVPQHRCALTLRYVDGLPVAEVAELLGRTLHATEALLVRARIAFRHAYEGGMGDG